MQYIYYINDISTQIKEDLLILYFLLFSLLQITIQIKRQCAYQGCQEPPVIKTIDEINIQNKENPEICQIFCCKKHFIQHFEDTVNYTCQKYNLMPPGSNILIGVSGGKDSSSLLHCLYQLVYVRYRNLYADKNVNLYMCAVDEGIKGYRTPSLNVVYQLQKQYNLPLEVVSFEKEYGRTLDKLVTDLEQPQLSCSYCGILRRNSLGIGAQHLIDQGLKDVRIATGHNADDQAETVLLNITRGDYNKLQYCTNSNLQLNLTEDDTAIKIKPYTRISQKDIVMYAHYCQVPYFSTECPYAVTALRGLPRAYIRRESRQNPLLCLNIIDSIDQQMVKNSIINQNKKQAIHRCPNCGNPITGNRCQVCLIKAAKTKQELKEVIKFKKSDL